MWFEVMIVCGGVLSEHWVSNSKGEELKGYRAKILKVPPHSPSDKVLGDFTKSLLRYPILKLVICTYLLYLLEHFPACTNT